MDDFKRDLREGRTAIKRVPSATHGGEVPVIFVPLVDEHGPALLIALPQGASVTVRPGTPPNKFELVRGNIPIDVADKVMLLLQSLAGPDTANAQDAIQMEQN